MQFIKIMFKKVYEKNYFKDEMFLKFFIYYNRIKTKFTDAELVWLFLVQIFYEFGKGFENIVSVGDINETILHVTNYHAVVSVTCSIVLRCAIFSTILTAQSLYL
jgi:hypothetical protein